VGHQRSENVDYQRQQSKLVFNPPNIITDFLSSTSLFFRYFVMAKTDPTKKQGEAFTGFIVERDTPGITVRPHPPNFITGLAS
jgi:hypothetical protein